MAKEDYNVADRVIEGGVEAAGVLARSDRGETPDADAAARAKAEGVSHPAYIDYAEALENYAARADIEGLAERRAREYGSEFTDADFMRRRAYKDYGSAADAPRPGTVHGDAPEDV